MRRITGCVLVLAIAACILYQKRDAIIGVTAVLVYATFFSLLLSPFCMKMEKYGIRVSYSAGIAVCCMFLTVFVLLAALVPYMITQSAYLFKRLSPIAAELSRWMLRCANEIGFINIVFSGSGDVLRLPLAEITGMIAKAGMTAAAQIGRIGFAMVLTYYILRDRKRIHRHLLLLLPTPWRNPVYSGMQACRNVIMSYLSGLLKTSAFVGTATWAGLTILGVQDAWLLSLFMGVMEVLPYLGPIIASIPILLSALTLGTEGFLLVLGMIILVQQLEGNFVSPYFTASSTSIRPLAALLGVFVIGSLIGIWGILLALPLMMLCQSVCISFRQARMAIKENA